MGAGLTSWNLLLVDDDEDECTLIRQMLPEIEGREVRLVYVRDLAECRAALQEKFDAVLVDAEFEGESGIELIRGLSELGYPAPPILISGRINSAMTLQAMQAGATICLNKSELDRSVLEESILYARSFQQAKSLHAEEFSHLVDTLDTLDVGIFGLDSDWRFTFLNRKAAVNVNRQREHLIGKEIWAEFPQLLGTPFETNFRRGMAEGEPLEFQTSGVITRSTYEIHIYPMKVGISVHWMDISARKKMEEKLIESERNYRELVKYAAVGIYEFDFRTQKFTSVNDAMCELSGYSRQELLSMDPNELLDDESRALFAKRLELSLKGEKPTENVEYRVRCKDGRELTCELNVSFISNPEGRISGAAVIGYDITERKLAEAKLKEYSARLEQSNKQLEDFALIASHDLQEPLRKVEGFGRLLEQSAAGRLNETELDYLGRLTSGAHRMRQMIDGLLALSRVTTRGHAFVPVDLNQVLLSVQDDLSMTIEQSGGRLEVGELPVIKADPMQMHQLFQNLVANGLKFHKQDVPPVVKVSARYVIGRVELIVEDNGIGFDMKDVEKVFQPFQRLHSRSKYEGTGIGLSICRKIVDRHQGLLTAESQPGEGSRFIVILPLSSITTGS